ncbi:hypothetical protein F5Y02DRAFT_414490 [Annulohypoxylon stygium]|nr:hypothetical protein F5Y02DRAFT_414490 [Annulohypoxylon stygium]
MRFTLSLAILATCAMCAPAPVNSGRDTTVASVDEDSKVIYPDYRRAETATRDDEDSKVIYPDYRRAETVTRDDEDSKVIYPDY